MLFTVLRLLLIDYPVVTLARIPINYKVSKGQTKDISVPTKIHLPHEKNCGDRIHNDRPRLLHFDNYLVSAKYSKTNTCCYLIYEYHDQTKRTKSGPLKNHCLGYLTSKIVSTLFAFRTVFFLLYYAISIFFL